MLLCGCAASAQKSVYIPWEWRNASSDTLLYAESDPNNQYTWSKSRSIESDNVIIFWDKYYGNTSPSQTASPYHVDIEDLLEKCEAFFDLEINQLGFVDPTSSNLSRYKVMVLMNHTTEWACYGGGYDFQVSALWLSPNTCQPVGHAVAHEIGHSFHYMCYSEASNHGSTSGVQTGFHGAVGNGSVTWEQTAQWQANQSYPEYMFSESINVFRNSHNYAYTHEWHRYQSYWFFYYLCQYYNDIKTVANVWNHPETTVKDFNQVLMDNKSLSVSDLFRMYYDYAAHCATWDFDAAASYRNNYIGDFNYRCAIASNGKYQVALASCPQSTGFNVIPLSVPASGTTVTTHFTALPTGASLATADPSQYLDGETQWASSGLTAYNSVSNADSRGFRLGYVALLSDGTRQYFSGDKIYCTGTTEKTEDVSFTVPANTQKMWLIVSPSPSRYYQHRWDEAISADDMWPYQFTIDGTDLSAKAIVYAEPALDGRDIQDVTFTYDVYFPSANDYSGASVTISGKNLSTLGTALQIDPSTLSSLMESYSTAGPSNGKVMFYAAKADGSLQASASTANGYGHWFQSDGTAASYGNNTLVYSEFTPGSMTFNLGQYPNLNSNGTSRTIRQALRYNQDGTHYATAYFVFNIHFDADKTDVIATGTDYEGEETDENVSTYYVTNGTFEGNTTEGWTSNTGVQNNGTSTNPSGDGMTNISYENWNPTPLTGKIYQTITDLSTGTYRLTFGAFVNNLDNNMGQYVYANDDEVYLDTNSKSYSTLVYVSDGTVEIGLAQTIPTANWMAIDNISLVYVSSKPLADNYTSAKARAEQATSTSSLTCDERTALETVLRTYPTLPTTEQDLATAIAAINTATNTFVAAEIAYQTLDNTKAEIRALGVDLNRYPYATDTKMAALNAVLNATPSSPDEAVTLAGQLYSLARAVAESHAMMERMNATDMTSLITNADASSLDGWTTSKTYTTLNAESLTDASGNAAHNYFDTNGSDAATISQQISTLPKGHYLLTLSGRASVGTTYNVTVTDAESQSTSVALTPVGNTGGLFGRGWNDLSVEFDQPAAGTLDISISTDLGSEWYWMSACRFRLYRLGLEGDVNMDGNVDINDVVLTINHVLGTSSDAFHMEYADVSPDGVIDVNDVVVLINWIVSGNTETPTIPDDGVIF
mgnify:CR=1 FL=1